MCNTIINFVSTFVNDITSTWNRKMSFSSYLSRKCLLDLSIFGSFRCRGCAFRMWMLLHCLLATWGLSPTNDFNWFQGGNVASFQENLTNVCLLKIYVYCREGWGWLIRLEQLENCKDWHSFLLQTPQSKHAEAEIHKRVGRGQLRVPNLNLPKNQPAFQA